MDGFMQVGFQHNFTLNESVVLDAGALSFPCNENKEVRFEVIETDRFRNNQYDLRDDIIEVALPCKYLQLGKNTLNIPMTENSNMVTYAATVAKTDDAIAFNFGD